MFLYRTQKTHPSLFVSYEKEKLEILSGSKRMRIDPSTSGSSQRSMSIKDFVRTTQNQMLVSQSTLDKAIIKYVMMDNIPFSTVESPYFRKVALLGLKSSLHVMTQKTLVKKLETKYNEMKEAMKTTLDEIDYVATTADAWTKHRRSYLGVTIHWIEPESLERKSAALALRRLTGRHTFDVLAAAIHDIHKEYVVHNKVN